MSLNEANDASEHTETAKKHGWDMLYAIHSNRADEDIDGGTKGGETDGEEGAGRKAAVKSRELWAVKRYDERVLRE